MIGYRHRRPSRPWPPPSTQSSAMLDNLSASEGFPGLAGPPNIKIDTQSPGVLEKTSPSQNVAGRGVATGAAPPAATGVEPHHRP